ncbi:MAG: hypothetical protein L0Z53_00595 [Acidobacteriales bacterium]|nr:hypothetical protein [Terriglobales bacterium]
MMHFRVLVAIFSGVVMLISTVLIPFAYWGDKNPTWTKRLIVIDFLAAVAFLLSVFWGV